MRESQSGNFYVIVVPIDLNKNYKKIRQIFPFSR